MNLKKRIQKAKANADNFRSMLEVAYDYVIPEKNGWNQNTRGKEENTHIYDETAVNGVVVASNRMQGALMPPQQKWHSFASGEQFDEDEAKQLDDALSEATDVYYSYFKQSNFDTEINPSLQDCLISTGYLQIDENPITDEQPFYFTSVPAYQMAPEKPIKGVIENCHRTITMELQSVIDTWPDAELPDGLRDKLSNDPYCEIEICISQIMEGKQYKLVVSYKHKPIFEQMRSYKFMIPFRESVNAGDVLGRGVILRMLPLIRRLNKVEQYTLENAALNVSGVYTGVSGSSFNPYTARIAPASIIPVSSNDSANPTLRALDRAGDVGLGNMLVNEMRDILEKALYINPLGDITDPTKTATEQTIRQQEMLRSQGAAIGRLKNELLNPVIKSITAILKERGLLPDFKIGGDEVRIVFQSPLAQAEKMDDFQALQTYIGFLQGIAQTLPPEMAAMFMAGTLKIEDIPSKTAKLLGVSTGLIRSKNEVQQLGQALQGAMQGGESGQPVQ